MTKPLKMLAFDFGASSGRAILGIFDVNKLITEELHRFSNDPVNVRGNFYWDILRLFHEIKQGIIKCVNVGHKDIDSIGIDTWGVDYGLLDERGNLLGNPYHYRDTRTDGIMEEVFKIIPKGELYQKTGIQFMKFNTIFQLYSTKLNTPSMLDQAKTLLFIPDLLNYFLTGVKVTEYSIASTSQLLDPQTRTWSDEILDKLELPRQMLTDIVPSGTIIGKLSKTLAQELGIGEVNVVASASHDTASAVTAVPAANRDYVYISSGTWSLMGVEADEPIINEMSSQLAFTNEGGVSNKIRFLKNIMGLWLVQECKRQWNKEGDNCSFAELEKLAREAKPFVSFVDPDDDSFMTPGNMPEKIRAFCKKTNQPVPESKGEVIRCVLQSLALKYRKTVESLEQILGKELPVVHMVGGGIKDTLLCQFTANATGKKVIAGPVEATSIGNLMTQAMALSKINSLQEIRQVVKNSFETTEYLPEDIEQWNQAYGRFCSFCG